MKKLLPILVLSIMALTLLPTAVFAQKAPSGGGKPSTGGNTELVGYDISWPQCGDRLPTDHYFAIIGVNGGTAANTNPCLADQLAWANTAKTGSTQARVQLYVNTANPGEVIDQITTWPTSNVDPTGVLTTNPYGDCDGTNTAACSWQYGWNRSVEADVQRFKPAAQAAGISTETANYVWWLDVETMNTWQLNGTEAFARNTAAIEGFGAYYQSKGATVGLYSTAYQWGEITGGTVGATSNLNGLANWRPSGSSLQNAISNCSVAPLTTGGFISLTQYIRKGLDYNHSCI